MTETPDRRRTDHAAPVERIEVPVLVHLCPHDRCAKILGIGVVIGILIGWIW